MMPNEKIGLGTVQFGTRYGITNQTGQTPAEEVARILKRAFTYGVRTIDTASAYGNAEQVLGENDLKAFQVISKFMPATTGQSIAQQLEITLDHLRLDSLYGYLAHRPVNLLEGKKQWDELRDLKDKGKVKKIGYSLNEPKELTLLLEQEMRPDLVQVPFNYFDTRFKEQLIALKTEGCEVHTRSAFLQGLFFMDPGSLSPFFSEVKGIIGELQRNYNEALPGALLKHVLNMDFIDLVIIGVENEKQLIDNMERIQKAPDMPAFNSNISPKILMPSNWPQ